MKKTKRNVALLVVVLLLMVCLPVGTVLALFREAPQTAVSVYIPGVVDVEVVETFSNNQKSDVALKNTGNTDAYLRVRLMAYWQDSKGAIVGREVTYPNVTIDTQNWIYDDHNQTYYYKHPVAPNETTPDLLANGTVIQLQAPVTEPHNNVTYTYYYVVEFVAEAIQAKPTKAAVDNWGLTINDNGVITKIN